MGGRSPRLGRLRGLRAVRVLPWDGDAIVQRRGERAMTTTYTY